MAPAGYLELEKWSGAGNTFLLLERTALPGGAEPAQLARRLCRRGPEWGADGLILLDEERAEYWNADGSPADFCGNGARCVAAKLWERGGEQRVQFSLGTIAVTAWREEETVALALPPPSLMARRVPQALLAAHLGAGATLLEAAALVDAGVPHLVLRQGVPDPLEDLWQQARSLRSDAWLGPPGANVDLIWACAAADGVLAGWLRTWERGLEAETYACGSGALAAAALLFEREKADRAFLKTRGGHELSVQRRVADWILRGPARRVSREWVVAGGDSAPPDQLT